MNRSLKSTATIIALVIDERPMVFVARAAGVNGRTRIR